MWASVDFLSSDLSQSPGTQKATLTNQADAHKTVLQITYSLLTKENSLLVCIPTAIIGRINSDPFNELRYNFGSVYIKVTSGNRICCFLIL